MNFKSPNKFLSIVFVVILLFGIFQLFKYISKKKRKSLEIVQTTQINPEETVKEEIKEPDYSATLEKEEEHLLVSGNEITKGPEDMNEEVKSESEQTEEDKTKLDYIKKVFKDKNPFAILKKKPTGSEGEFDEGDSGIDRGGEKPVEFQVTSIILGENIKMATINIAPFEIDVNDRIFNERVSDILSDHIILSKNGDKREIFLNYSKDSKIKMEGAK